MSTSSSAVRLAARVGGDRRRGQMIIAVGAVCWSTAGVFQRHLTVNVGTQVAGRAFFAMLTLLTLTVVANRGEVVAPFVRVGKAGVGVALATASASGCFIIALNHTSVAHVLFVQAASPLLAGLLAWIFLKERIGRRSLLAMAAALVGVGVMMGNPSDFSLIGDGLSLLMALSFAIAVVLTREHREVSMIPATCMAQVILVVCAAPFASLHGVGGQNLALLVWLGVVQIGIGLALFAAGARLIPAAEVALISLLEVVLGPLWVFLSLGERPDTATLVGGCIVAAAVIAQALSSAGADSPPAPIGAQ